MFPCRTKVNATSTLPPATISLGSSSQSSSVSRQIREKSISLPHSSLWSSLNSPSQSRAENHPFRHAISSLPRQRVIEGLNPSCGRSMMYGTLTIAEEPGPVTPPSTPKP